MTTQYIITAIQQTPLCSKVNRIQLVKLLANEIAQTVARAGHTMDKNDLLFTSEEVVQLILEDYYPLHVGELPIIIRAGIFDKFGSYFGVNAVSINRWIACYLDSDYRKKAAQEVLRISVERQLPAKAPVTPQGEYASLRQMIGEAYDKYLRGEAISDPGCCHYKFLTQLGLLKPCDKFKPYIDCKGKVKKYEYEFPTDHERCDALTRLFDEIRFDGQHILDVVPENMVDGYWIMFPTW